MKITDEINLSKKKQDLIKDNDMKILIERFLALVGIIFYIYFIYFFTDLAIETFVEVGKGNPKGMAMFFLLCRYFYLELKEQKNFFTWSLVVKKNFTTHLFPKFYISQKPYLDNLNGHPNSNWFYKNIFRFKNPTNYCFDNWNFLCGKTFKMVRYFHWKKIQKMREGFNFLLLLIFSLILFGFILFVSLIIGCFFGLALVYQKYVG